MDRKFTIKTILFAVALIACGHVVAGGHYNPSTPSPATVRVMMGAKESTLIITGHNFDATAPTVHLADNGWRVGCTTQLAPLYDKALVGGLTPANAGIMELIASIAGGTTKETFPAREPKYSKVICTTTGLILPVPTRSSHG